MEYIIGILLLISFVGLAVYAVRGGNLMMGMLIMAIIWTVLPLIGNTFATNPEFIGSYPGIQLSSVYYFLQLQQQSFQHYLAQVPL